MAKGSRLWPLVFGVAAGALFIAERLRPLRTPRDPAPTRVPRNLAIGLLAAATTAASDAPIVRPALRLSRRCRVGLLQRIPMPRRVRFVLGFLLLDYTLYLWHWLNHRLPSLWRFHAVHHLDLDLDSTTGIRFHFGELALAAGFRAAQILLLGVDEEVLRIWQRALLLGVVFQHSNLALPSSADAQLAAVVVTPRMHGIHHSTRAEERNTNYSSLLACWDRLHATLRLDVPQGSIAIGVEGFDDPEVVTLRRSLELPFARPDLLPAGSPSR